jgi:hypothetical protein
MKAYSMSDMSNMRPAGRMSCVALMTTQMRPIWPSGDPRFDMPALDNAHCLLLPGIEPHFLYRPSRNLVFIQTGLPWQDQRSDCSRFTLYISIRTQHQQANFLTYSQMHSSDTPETTYKTKIYTVSYYYLLLFSLNFLDTYWELQN